MKVHHLIFASTALFILLFYDEYLGLNFAIFGLIVSILVYINTQKKNRDKTFLFLFVASILSSFAFAWYGDPVSFLAETSSVLLLRFKSKNRNFKSLFVLPVFVVNIFSFIYNVFQIKQWFPKSQKSDTTKKLIAYLVIPLIFVVVFFSVYSLGSDHFSNIFSEYKWNIDFFTLFGVALLGFFISFVFWNLLISKSVYKANRYLNNDFIEEQKELKPTYDFLEINYERTSGVISLIALNILLLLFISTYTYEQFFEIAKTPNQLSVETHDGVNAVIMSIIMAILVILFYFKAGFNFDQKAKYLKLLAKIWIVLNVILIFSTLAKNTEYIINLGFTYKRLGVYAFLFLSILGLFFTFLKIKNQKTNAYLFNQMFWCFFGIILVCSFINWGGFITTQNIKRQYFDVHYHSTFVNFNEEPLLDYAEKNKNENLKLKLKTRIEKRKAYHFLSKTLYYDGFSFNK